MPGGLRDVDIDNVEGVCNATDYLLDTGRRNVACAGGPEGVPSVEDRKQGFLRACAEAGVRPGPYLYGKFDTDFGMSAATAILEAEPGVDGIFAHSDAMGRRSSRREPSMRFPDSGSKAVFWLDDLGHSL